MEHQHNMPEEDQDFSWVEPQKGITQEKEGKDQEEELLAKLPTKLKRLAIYALIALGVSSSPIQTLETKAKIAVHKMAEDNKKQSEVNMRVLELGRQIQEELGDDQEGRRIYSKVMNSNFLFFEKQDKEKLLSKWEKIDLAESLKDGETTDDVAFLVAENGEKKIIKITETTAAEEAQINNKGINKEHVIRFISGLPEAMILNINEIAIVSKNDKGLDLKMSENYGIKGQWAGQANKTSKKITFVQESIPLQYLNSIGLHESFHLFDYQNIPGTAAEKLSLFLKVTNRIDAENRYRSSYVENINNPLTKETTKQKWLPYLAKINEKETKSEEYFAELMSAYFCDKECLSTLGPEDREIINQVVRMGSENGVFSLHLDQYESR